MPNKQKSTDKKASGKQSSQIAGMKFVKSQQILREDQSFHYRVSKCQIDSCLGCFAANRDHHYNFDEAPSPKRKNSMKKQKNTTQRSETEIDQGFSDFTLLLVNHCVRNTFLEDLHAGTSPSSKTGDFSDVKVVTPYGEIPWNHLSRLSDEEMKKLMKEFVNKVYSMLHYCFILQKEFPLHIFYMPYNWDPPEIDDGFKTVFEHLEKEKLSKKIE